MSVEGRNRIPKVKERNWDTYLSDLAESRHEF